MLFLVVLNIFYSQAMPYFTYFTPYFTAGLFYSQAMSVLLRKNDDE